MTTDTQTVDTALVRTQVKVTSEDGLSTYFMRWVDGATDTFSCLEYDGIDRVTTVDNPCANINIEIAIPSFIERCFTDKLMEKFSDFILDAISSENGN